MSLTCALETGTHNYPYCMEISRGHSIIQALYGLLQALPYADFTQPVQNLSGATIGEHTRHIIEMFQCLEAGYSSGQVCYENRKRDPLLQTSLQAAMQALQQISAQWEKVDKPIMLLANSYADISPVRSSYYRELIYCTDHCIHHQALIKVALRELNRSEAVDSNFGVAPSTIAYRLQQDA